MALMAALTVYPSNTTSSTLRLALTLACLQKSCRDITYWFLTSVRVMVLLHQHEALANLHSIAVKSSTPFPT